MCGCEIPFLFKAENVYMESDECMLWLMSVDYNKLMHAIWASFAYIYITVNGPFY